MVVTLGELVMILDLARQGLTVTSVVHGSGCWLVMGRQVA